MKGRLLIVGSIVALAIPASRILAVTPAEAHRNAIVWLETNQNGDGSWGSGLTRPVATAEALLALTKAGRPRGAAAQKAAAWLLTRSYASLDHRARAVRALAAAGFSTVGLSSFGAATKGWGPVAADQGVTSYDSALVMAAIRASGQTTNLADPTAEVISRRRTDAGWSGDDVPHSQTAKSDYSATAEIMRAMTQVDGSSLGVTAFVLSGVAPTTSTLEIAARLAALYAYGSSSDQIETTLLDRMAGGSWGSDPLVNALGLLAISSKPGRTLGGSATQDDDGDGCLNSADAFPQDPGECLDSDGDGRGNNADADDDGDGVCEGATVQLGQCSATSDAFPLNPREWADTDADGTGDQADTDADGDGVSDEAELEAGSDPSRRDSDGDGVCDGAVAIAPCTGANDPCPTVVSELDQDGDGVCSDRDACDLDPTDWRDTNNNGVCDVADDDDDGDGFSDREELAAGTDPRFAGSTPVDLAQLIPAGDFDWDGLTNGEEGAAGTSPFVPDTDQDGATDYAEVPLGSALDPNSHPVAAPGVFGVFGAFPAAGGTFPAEKTSALLRGTATGGQPTPVARLGGSLDLPSAGLGYESLAGFQAQCTIGRDLDGDGLIGLVEAERRTSFARADTDGDGFVDGPDGKIATAGYAGPVPWDLQPNGFVDGEDDHGTDPADSSDHPGKPGDVAPLGLPDGRITAGDATVELQIVADPARTSTLTGQRKQIADQASDANSDQAVDVRDALRVLQQAGSATP